MSLNPIGALIDTVVDAVAGGSPEGEVAKGALKLAEAFLTGDVMTGIEGGMNLIDGISKSDNPGDVLLAAVSPGGFMTKQLVEKLTDGYAKGDGVERRGAHQALEGEVSHDSAAVSTGTAHPSEAATGCKPPPGCESAKTESTKKKEDPRKTSTSGPATQKASSGPAKQVDLADHIDRAVTRNLFTSAEVACLIFDPDRKEKLAGILEDKIRNDPMVRKEVEDMLGSKIDLEGSPIKNGYVVLEKTREIGGCGEAEELDAPEVLAIATPAPPASSHTGSARDPNRFKGMSPEDIVEALMMEMAASYDEAMVAKAEKLIKAQDHVLETEGGKDEKGRKANGEAKLDADRIQQQFTTLMERRKSMFDMLSHFSNIRHEMAKTAVGNMARI
jgi:hypothetical protein